jgi:hypothetical protein
MMPRSSELHPAFINGACRSPMALRSRPFLALALVGCLIHLLHFARPVLSDAVMSGSQFVEQACGFLYSLIPLAP